MMVTSYCGSKMVVEPLLLNHNEYALSLLEELGSLNVRNAKQVAIIQNAAIYYQCLVTKRQLGTILPSVGLQQLAL